MVSKRLMQISVTCFTLSKNDRIANSRHFDPFERMWKTANKKKNNKVQCDCVHSTELPEIWQFDEKKVYVCETCITIDFHIAEAKCQNFELISSCSLDKTQSAAINLSEK